MRRWTFNHEEALCLYCKQGALGRAESHLEKEA